MAHLVRFLLAIQIVFAATGTIDGAYKYAWSENAGWVNFGTSEGNVVVNDSELTGYAWGENIGWISLNCSNTSSCGTVSYSVTNDINGNLGGYAWSENAGWINFDPGFGANAAINTSGEFTGYAWGENIGWLNFNCVNTGYCSTVDYKVKTSWRPASSGGGGPGPAPAPQASSTSVPTTSAMPSSTTTPAVTTSSTPLTSQTPVVATTTPNTKPPIVPQTSGNVPPQDPPGTPTTDSPSSPPSGAVPSAPPADSGSEKSAISSEIIEAIKNVTRPFLVTAEKSSQPVSIATTLGVAISTTASAVSLASSGINILTYIEFFLKNILVFFGLKKKTRAWGTIYDSVTKRPLPYTKVQLMGKDMRVLETRVTDREGRYGFLINSEGIDSSAILEIQIQPLREKFSFPSRIVTSSSDTVLYEHIYNGGIVQIRPNDLIKFDIPLDAQNIPQAGTSLGTKMLIMRMRFHNIFAFISHAMFWIAIVAVPLNYILHPSFLNLVMLIVFGGLNLLILVGDLQQRPFGVVLDQSMNAPVPYSLITLQDATGQRKGFTVSDEQGRYFLLSDKGSYKISAFTPAQISPPRSSEESLSTDRGWVAKKLHL